MLGQAGRLSERQRVKPRLPLPLIRIRYFVVSLIPWSEAQSRPPSPQNTFENRPCFRTFFIRKLVNFIAEPFTLHQLILMCRIQILVNRIDNPVLDQCHGFVLQQPLAHFGVLNRHELA